MPTHPNDCRGLHCGGCGTKARAAGGGLLALVVLIVVIAAAAASSHAVRHNATEAADTLLAAAEIAALVLLGTATAALLTVCGVLARRRALEGRRAAGLGERQGASVAAAPVYSITDARPPRLPGLEAGQHHISTYDTLRDLGIRRPRDIRASRERGGAR